MSDSTEGDPQRGGPRGIVNPDTEKIIETLKDLQDTVLRNLSDGSIKKKFKLPEGWWWKSLLLGAVAWTVLLASLYVLDATPSISNAIGSVNTNLDEMNRGVDSLGIFLRTSSIAEAIDGNDLSQRGKETGNVSLVEAVDQLTVEVRELKQILAEGLSR